MPADRYFIDAPLQQGDFVTLDGSEHHHLTHVMRAQVGDVVELVNGKGFLAEAAITALTRRDATLHLESVAYEGPSSFTLILAQAVPRMNRLDLIVEKGTELGMSALWLFSSERSERQKLTEHQLERLRNLAISAMKQCGRLYLPEIIVKEHLIDTFALSDHAAALFGDVSKEAPSLLSFWLTVAQRSELLFFVGPESGFTEKEEERLKKRGAYGVALHRNILRTDTAAISAVALLQHLRLFF